MTSVQGPYIDFYNFNVSRVLDFVSDIGPERDLENIRLSPTEDLRFNNPVVRNSAAGFS
jgi:hypothetical protein